MQPIKTDTISLYLRGLNNCTRLTKKETDKLWKRVRQGDLTAKQKIIESNLRLVIPIAQKFLRPGLDLLDLIEEGNLGLLHAVEKFDLRKKVAFASYATYWIKHSIIRCLDTQLQMIHIPAHIQKLIRRGVKQLKQMQAERGGNFPPLSEIAKKLKLTSTQVRQLFSAYNISITPSSLSAPIDDDEENLVLEDVISDTHSVTPEQIFNLLRVHDELEEALAHLSRKERGIVERRFGLYDQRVWTFNKIGREMKLSRERVRQITNKAIARLLKYISQRGWERLTSSIQPK